MTLLGPYYLEDVRSAQGDKFKANPIAIELMSDIAILYTLDMQTYENEPDQYFKFTESRKPVLLSTQDYFGEGKFPIFIYTHEGKWVSGMAEQGHPGAKVLAVEVYEPILPGTSGSPIVNEAGEIVAVVSHFTDFPGTLRQDGVEPRPHLCIPIWIL